MAGVHDKKAQAAFVAAGVGQGPGVARQAKQVLLLGVGHLNHLWRDSIGIEVSAIGEEVSAQTPGVSGPFFVVRQVVLPGGFVH